MIGIYHHAGSPDNLLNWHLRVLGRAIIAPCSSISTCVNVDPMRAADGPSIAPEVRFSELDEDLQNDVKLLLEGLWEIIKLVILVKIVHRQSRTVNRFTMKLQLWRYDFINRKASHTNRSHSVSKYSINIWMEQWLWMRRTRGSRRHTLLDEPVASFSTISTAFNQNYSGNNNISIGDLESRGKTPDHKSFRMACRRCNKLKQPCDHAYPVCSLYGYGLRCRYKSKNQEDKFSSAYPGGTRLKPS